MCLCVCAFPGNIITSLYEHNDRVQFMNYGRTTSGKIQGHLLYCVLKVKTPSLLLCIDICYVGYISNKIFMLSKKLNLLLLSVMVDVILRVPMIRKVHKYKASKYAGHDMYVTIWRPQYADHTMQTTICR